MKDTIYHNETDVSILLLGNVLEFLHKVKKPKSEALRPQKRFILVEDLQ